jgi:hypothetical protein
MSLKIEKLKGELPTGGWEEKNKYLNGEKIKVLDATTTGF